MKRALVIIGFVSFITVPQVMAQVAGPPPPCVVGTLAQYESQGVCSVGTNLEFEGFSFTPGEGRSLPDLDTLITVTPDPEGLGGGFTFSGWQAGVVDPDVDASYDIGYSLAIFGDPPTVDASSLGMDPVTGSVVIGEQLCPPGFDCFNDSVSSLEPPSTLCDQPNLTSPCWEATEQLPNISTASVSDTITLTGGNSGAGFDDLDNIFHVAPDAPEPITWVLCLGGLAAIAVIRRCRCIG